jgi:hypothetical protein
VLHVCSMGLGGSGKAISKWGLTVS